MKTLLKIDFKRMLTDKLFIIAAIIIFGISLFIPLLFKGLDIMINSLSNKSEPIPNFYAKMLLPVGFAEFIIPLIFVLITINKDFSSGIIRNKIICGYSKTKIYFSLTIVAIVSIVIISLLSSLTMFGVSLALFDYSLDGSTFGDDFGKLLIGVVVNMLVICAYVSISTLFSIGLQKLPIGIILAVAVSSIEQLIILLLTALLAQNTDILNVISNFFLGSLMNKSFSPVDAFDYVMIFVIPVVYSTLFISLGYLLFRKRDVK